MSAKRRYIELLSPARNYEAAIAAIDCGADAIYIGAESFGARRGATNTSADIARVVDYAHLFGVKVFVTLNTILYERELKEAGVEYKVGKFPFQAIGRAVAGGDTEGFVKLLFGKENGELLGAHIVGDNATELLTAPGLALSSEMTEEDLNAMIYAHPTLSEAIHEAVLAADGRAIHA